MCQLLCGKSLLVLDLAELLRDGRCDVVELDHRGRVVILLDIDQVASSLAA